MSERVRIDSAEDMTKHMRDNVDLGKKVGYFMVVVDPEGQFTLGDGIMPMELLGVLDITLALKRMELQSAFKAVDMHPENGNKIKVVN